MAQKKTEERDLYDKVPPELDGIDTTPSEWVQSSTRTRDIVIFCCGLGCVWSLLDRCFSNLTGQDRVFYKSKQPHINVRTVDSVQIISELSNERQFKHFATKYYGRFRLWHEKTIDDIERVGEQLLLQTNIDTTERHYRKDGAINQIAWVATILGACVSIIEFIRAIIAEDPHNQAALKSIGYVEGFLGLSALIITQIKNKQIQIDSKAATALDNFYNWAFAQVETLKTAANPGSPHQAHAKNRLLRMHFYRVIISESDDKPLLKAIAAARNNRGFNETDIILQRRLAVYKTQHAEINDNTFAEEDCSSLHDVENLAHALGCPIFVVTEYTLPNGGHHILFEGTRPMMNAVAVIDDGDVHEEEKENNPAKQIILDNGPYPENFIVLYSSAPNQYEALTIPLMSQPIRHEDPIENRPINYEETKATLQQLDAYLLAASEVEAQNPQRSSSMSLN